VTRLLVILCSLCLIPATLVGQGAQPDTVYFGVRKVMDRSMFILAEPRELRSPWLGMSLSPAQAGQAWAERVSARLQREQVVRANTQLLSQLYGRMAFAVADSADRAAGRRGVLGIDPRYADLSLDAQARFELRTDRLKNERCTTAEALRADSGCRAKFKAPRLDTEFSALAGGVIAERVHINVDWDSQRELNASNTIQVFYQGLEDEIIRRIEVGTVSFQPPPSRFITSQIPSNNFGVNAAFEVGPWQIQALVATQEGSVVNERRFTIGATASEPQDRALRDLDFESNRFFWVVDPTVVPGYPAVDILNLAQLDQVPTDVLPSQVRLYRFRPRAGQGAADPNLGGINAFGVRGGSEPGLGARWELLIQNLDYYLDPSGLWFVLNTKLASNEYISVSYLTEGGQQVGTFPEQDRGLGPNQEYLDTLQLVGAPQTLFGQSIFLREMRQVYRIAGTDLNKSTLTAALTLNRSERPLSGGADTYIALLGLALPTDPNVLDIENRVFPRSRDAGATTSVGESYIIFPHLTPFADGTKLSTAPERQDSLYRTPTYLVLGSQGPPTKYAFRLQYEAAGGSDRSQVNLNALSVQEGTDRLVLNGRVLERGIDYEIDYALGVVTFLDPDILFGSGTAQLVARFEERGFFAIAPTSVFGLTTTYSLGDVGAINFMGLYQQEQSAFTRPPLGFEPTANFIGGVTTQLRFRPSGVTRFLNSLTSTPATAPSVLDINAEFALSRPVANRIGEAYIDEFEADAGFRISTGEARWAVGSIPNRTDGLSLPGFGVTFDTTDAVQMSWQNLILRGGAVAQVFPQDIDPGIVIAGAGESQETVLYLTFHADTAGGIVRSDNSSLWSRPQRNAARFRPLVISLSNTGIDLSNNQFLEFWMFTDSRFTTPQDAGLEFIFDLGTVNEDVLALAPDSLTITGVDSSYTGTQHVGVGRLDTERGVTGIFNAQTDDVGILGDRPDSILVVGQGLTFDPALCQRSLTSAVQVFPWGDLEVQCSNGNGILDTEDLNGDDVLNFNAANIADNVFRWVFTPAELGRFFVRNGRITSIGRWSLFRIPLDSPDQVLGVPNARLVQHLRLTVAGPTSDVDSVVRWGFARMKLTGAPWIRLADAPIDGISGSTANPTGEVVVTTISTTDNTDLGYVPPPGVTNAGNSSATSDDLGTEINESSLRIYTFDLVTGEALQVDQRVEAVDRFVAGPQNTLSYGELRVWFRGRGSGWEEGDLEAFLKMGSDDNNFYLYRTPASTTSWEPEAVIDLDIWRELRSQVEVQWLQGLPPSGAGQCGMGDSTAYVACSGPYLVQVADPGINPPNLAAVQQISAGILRVAATTIIDTAELWIDDIRLTRPVNQIGTALAIDGRLSASDVGNLTFGFTRRGSQFRQLGQDPSFQTTNNLNVSSTLRLERFLPPGLGLFVPTTISYARSSTDPELVAGTDIIASDLDGLRKPESWSTSFSMTVRRSRQGTDWVTRGLVDPFTITGRFTTGRARRELSQTANSATNLSIGYNLAPRPTSLSLGIGGLIGWLPDWFTGSEAGTGLRNARLSLAPRNVRFSSTLSRNQTDFTTFLVPVVLPSDGSFSPSISLSHLWVNSAGLTWQPLGLLTMSGDLSSTRDLRHYADSTSIGRLTSLSRQSFLGLDVGVEKSRTMSTQMSITPRINSWLRPRYVTGSTFGLNRDLTTRNPVRVDGDTAGAFVLPQTYNNSRTRELGAAVNVARLVQSIFGDSSGVTSVFARARPLDLSTRVIRSSIFDLATFEPSVGYRLGLGGMDQFLAQRGQLARGAREVITDRVSTGVTFPKGISAQLSYGLVRTAQFTRVGADFLETRIRAKEWPVGNVRWNTSIVSGPVALIGLGLVFRRTEGTTVTPRADGGQASVRLNKLKSLSPNMNLAFRNGLTLTAGYSSSNNEVLNNGNTTLVETSQLNGTLSYSFPLPRSISSRRRLVRTSLNALTLVSTSCLQRPGEAECLTINDIRRQEINASLDTDVSRILQGGLSLSYAINDARHIDRKTSQIIISLSFSLSLFAGDFR